MNDNLHKKFRRQNHHQGILHSASDGFSHGIPHSHPMEMNGDHENRSLVSNGQSLSTAGANHDNEDDDDDDIVLVSDDESEDKKSEKRLNRRSLCFALLLR